MEWTPRPAEPESAIMAECEEPQVKGAFTLAKIGTIGVDLGKRSFQLHRASEGGSAAFRRKVSRDRFLEEMSKHRPCTAAMEVCGGTRYWSRELQSMGLEIGLVPPTYVKPFVKRQTNDAADAEAICDAASRPTMRFVAVIERGAEGMPFRTRDLSAKQRTQTINALRGHLAEHGVAPPQGIASMARLGTALEAPEAGLPDAAGSWAGCCAARSASGHVRHKPLRGVSCPLHGKTPNQAMTGFDRPLDWVDRNSGSPPLSPP